jgi:hypothetical protein
MPDGMVKGLGIGHGVQGLPEERGVREGALKMSDLRVGYEPSALILGWLCPNQEEKFRLLWPAF